MDAKDDIKRRLSVEDVVGSYIELKRSGRNFKALSPFGNEKTPSFMISPDKQIWHDFSANRGGDIFTFVMEMEGVDFRGALEILARKAGLDLTNYSRGSGATAKKKARLQEALELAVTYYHLTLSKNQAALDYVKSQRGYTPETIKRFKLGYSPQSGQALRAFLLKKKFSDAELKSAGLEVTRRGLPGDMFRGRIMVPLMDGTGRAVGFTARLLYDEPDAPKYINTPQTLLYDKSRHVFGLHLAKEAMRTQDSAVVVEGNLDVIASHQAGITNCVATAGTALTRDHLVQVSRLTQNVKLAFDQDRAGLMATERSVPIASNVGINLSIVTIPEGKDPDELIKHNPSAWQKSLKASVYVMDWLLDHYAEVFDTSSARGKREYTDKLAEVVSAIADPVEQSHYVEQVAQKVGVPTERVAQKVRAALEKSQKIFKTPIKQPNGGNEARTFTYSYVDTFLGMLVLYPETRDVLRRLADVNFQDPRRRQLLDELRLNPSISIKSLKTDEEYVKIVTFRAEEYYGSSSSSQRLTDAMETARRIAYEIKKLRTKELAKQIQAAHDAADERSLGELLEQANQRLKED